MKYKIDDPETGEPLGAMNVEGNPTPEQLQEFAAQAVEDLRAKRTAKLSTLTDSGKIGCAFCGKLLLRGAEFNQHMQRHNDELNLGEKIE